MEDLRPGVAIPVWPGAPPGLHTVPPGAERSPRLTPFPAAPAAPAASAAPRAAMIVCPGGGYQRHAPHEGEPVARWLNTLGVTAFVLEYRLAPYRHPYPLLDAQRAIRTVRHHAARWNLDPQRIGILGFSAGGHLAACASTRHDPGDPASDDPVERVGCRPDALVLCYPVISFGPHGHRGSMVNLLGEDPPEELRRSLSTELQVTAGTPPAFLWHTAEDAGVPVENSLLFAGALSRHDVPFELHVFPHGRHGLGLAEAEPHVSAWTRLCSAWLAQVGFATTTA